MDAYLHLLFSCSPDSLLPSIDGIQDSSQFIAQEHGYDGRRRLIGPQPVVVAGACHRNPQQILVFVYRLDDGS